MRFVLYLLLTLVASPAPAEAARRPTRTAQQRAYKKRLRKQKRAQRKHSNRHHRNRPYTYRRPARRLKRTPLRRAKAQKPPKEKQEHQKKDEEDEEEEDAAPIFRHLPGLVGLEVQVGKAAIGYFLAAEGSYYISSHWQLKAGIGWETATNGSLVYHNVFSHPTLAYTLWSNGHNLYLNLLTGLVFFYEHCLEQRQGTRQTSFNAGGAVGLELELFLAGRWELVLSAAPRLMLRNEPYGRFGYALSLGTRISF